MKLLAAGYPRIDHPGPPIAAFRLHDRSKTVMHLRGAANRFQRERMRICDEFEGALSEADRKMARRVRTEQAISTGWKMFREGASRRSCYVWLGSLAISRPGALGTRYFWGSAARFAVQPRRSRAAGADGSS